MQQLCIDFMPDYISSLLNVKQENGVNEQILGNKIETLSLHKGWGDLKFPRTFRKEQKS